MFLGVSCLRGFLGAALLSVESRQDRLNSSNGSVAIFHPSRRHESLVQLQICPDTHQLEIVCNVEPDHLDEIFERLYAFLVNNDSHRQRLVELQALTGLCKTTNIYPLKLFQSAHRNNVFVVSTNPPASSQPESPRAK